MAIGQLSKQKREEVVDTVLALFEASGMSIQDAYDMLEHHIPETMKLKVKVSVPKPEQ